MGFRLHPLPAGDRLEIRRLGRQMLALPVGHLPPLRGLRGSGRAEAAAQGGSVQPPRSCPRFLTGEEAGQTPPPRWRAGGAPGAVAAPVGRPGSPRAAPARRSGQDRSPGLSRRRFLRCPWCRGQGSLGGGGGGVFNLLLITTQLIKTCRERGGTRSTRAGRRMVSVSFVFSRFIYVFIPNFPPPPPPKLILTHLVRRPGRSAGGGGGAAGPSLPAPSRRHPGSAFRSGRDRRDSLRVRGGGG